MWEDKKRRRDETEAHLKRMPVALMKHFDGSRGIGSFHDGVYKLVKQGTKAKDIIIFETIDDLSDAGWTITT